LHLVINFFHENDRTLSSNYKIIESEATGDILVNENSQYNNIKADRVTILENITARLFGTIKFKLTINKGARVYLHGSILGEVENQGGEFYKY